MIATFQYKIFFQWIAMVLYFQIWTCEQKFVWYNNWLTTNHEKISISKRLDRKPRSWNALSTIWIVSNFHLRCNQRCLNTTFHYEKYLNHSLRYNIANSVMFYSIFRCIIRKWSTLSPRFLSKDLPHRDYPISVLTLWPLNYKRKTLRFA